jgi:hypothetical protein
MYQTQSRKIFVSYKYLDTDVQELAGAIKEMDTNFHITPRHYVDHIIKTVGQEHVYKGEKSNEDISHLSDDTIDSKLKGKIFDSSVTIVLISPNMIDHFTNEEDQWIPNEISYSLRNKTREGRTSGANGLLAVILPDRNGNYTHAVYKSNCATIWNTGSFFKIIGDNMFNADPKTGFTCNQCSGVHFTHQKHSYIHPVLWDVFINNYNHYIDHAISLRDEIDSFNVRTNL